jgi:2-dehydro-3-deoxyphosphogluconate aldolase/(4S)-4-hydroxy-2-oxoglutarate aldolase
MRAARGMRPVTATSLRQGPTADAIRRHRLIVVLRRIEPRPHLIELAEQLADAGARAFEVTWDGADAADDLAALRESLTRREDGPYLVGAGTVTRREQLEEARRAGAAFAVAPTLDATVVAESVGEGLPFIPGAFTPTEVAAAWTAGATFVKLFPASAAGPSFVRELRGPMPDVELIATGGVGASNAGELLAAGAAAVGVGSALTRADPEARRVLVARRAGTG